ncbi:type II secretion system protein GspD [Geomonas subterranea]|uniref:type II secretion system protein GspD n=1 Tax=Geomonas subterranea TaxID=2847989 RepID=UPI001CD71FC0|nr:type II and III secretion system protein [Geomonas fuzhouensis]
MKKARLIVCSALALSGLVGCASPQMKGPTVIPSQEALTKQAESLLTDSPSIVKMSMGKAFILDEPDPGIPADLDIKLKSVEFFSEEIQTILYNLSQQKTKLNFVYESPVYPTASSTTTYTGDRTVAVNRGPETSAAAGTGNLSVTDQFTDRQDRTRRISISYSGKLSGFLKILSASSGYFFQYDPEAGAIVVKEREVFNLVIPNYTAMQKDKRADGKNFLIQEEIESSLKNLGARDISYDTFTSTLSFSADANGFKRIKHYVKSLRDNAALVTMRVMLLEVSLTDGTNTGIDWTKLIMGYKSQAQNPFGIAAMNQNNSTTDSSTTTDTLKPLAAGLGTVFNGTGAELFVEAKNFSLGMLLNFLQSYGHYSIAQNIRIESMSGTKGKFAVLTKTPYVDAVQFTALTQQATTATAGFTSKTAKSGVEIEIVPYYNKAEGSLSMALKVDVTGVTQMVTLQAGQQLGTVTQPEETVKSLENFLRFSPSHIAVIGGLTYEKLNNTSSGMPGDSYLTKTYGRSTQKTELVLVVKPTIFEFD